MLIVFLAGVVIGVPLGWSVLYIVAVWMARREEPLSKDEWKDWF